MKESWLLPNVGHIDKIFASCWLDDDNVLFGTKDNKESSI
jgi:hypothetical protein